MARPKAKSKKGNETAEAKNTVKAGKIEKPSQPKSKEKSALKKAAKETPAKLQNEKKPKPISKKKKEQIKKAREALASGELASEDKDRRIERDSRTLYLRFKDKENLPANKEAVRAMHKDIQTVRLPRQAQKRVLFAFAEFGTEEKCEEAKISLAKDSNLYVDYVGLKSKNGGKTKDERIAASKKKKQINPTRLFITGLMQGMTEEKLKQLFPKCSSANIPKGSIRKGTLYGFVQFSNPADAKSAFEAAKKLTVQTQEGDGSQRITVLYATATKHPVQNNESEDGENKVSKSKKKKNKKDKNEQNGTSEMKEEVKEEDSEMKDVEEKEENDSASDNEEVENDESSDEEEEKKETTKPSEEEAEIDSDSDEDVNMENDEESDEEEEDDTKNEENGENAEVENDSDSDEDDDE